MFTGIISETGSVRNAGAHAGGLDLEISMPWTDLKNGESVAVDGACLTVTKNGEGWFAVHVIATSLDRTAFKSYQRGRRVNLERALRVGDRLGGHMVQGHVDGVGTVESMTTRDDARLLDILVPPEVARVSVPLGSVTVDGVSLTINAVPRPGVLQVSLIPFTLEHTTLSERTPGDTVHVEGDTVAKYVRQMQDPSRPAVG